MRKKEDNRHLITTNIQITHTYIIVYFHQYLIIHNKI